MKFSKDGKFIKTWGKEGKGPGEFNEPHGIAMDSQGRLFVADRVNLRIQIFEQRISNPGPLHFHCHLPSIAQPRAMHLAERSGRHRCDVEIRKRLRHAHSEFRGDDFLDFIERERLHFVL